MTQYRFSAQTLTPIHVGCGKVIDPGEFLLLDSRLLQFNPLAVLQDLTEAERKSFINLADKGDFKELQRFFRSHCNPSRHGLGWIEVGDQARREFEAKLNKPANRFEIDLMPHNPYTGRPFLPGSSLKGAIRTAVVNYFTNLVEDLKPVVHGAVGNERDIRRKARVLEEKALNRHVHQTERDVFRLVEVADIELPNGSTRIDRVYNWNPNKKGSEGIQVWCERIRSRCDDADAPAFDIVLELDERAMTHPKVSGLLGRTLDMETVADACNRFYWGRMTAERNRFYKTLEGKPDGRQQVIYRAMSHIWEKDGQGRIQVSRPAWPHVLLRVGRFCQFESLSVDELRNGHRPQARGTEQERIHEMGATRNLCDMGPVKPALPFGWLLLTYEG